MLKRLTPTYFFYEEEIGKRSNPPNSRGVVLASCHRANPDVMATIDISNFITAASRREEKPANLISDLAKVAYLMDF